MTGILSITNHIVSGWVSPQTNNSACYFSSRENDYSEQKISDLIVAATVAHKINCYDKQIESISIGIYDWIDLFKQSFPDKNPYLYNSIMVEKFKIIPNLKSFRNITIHNEDNFVYTGIYPNPSGILQI